MREKNEIKLATMVYELSGDFVKKVDCDTLLNTEIKDRVVFFGPDVDLMKNGRAYSFFEAAVRDKYQHFLEKGEKSFVFYHSADPLCR